MFRSGFLSRQFLRLAQSPSCVRACAIALMLALAGIGYACIGMLDRTEADLQRKISAVRQIRAMQRLPAEANDPQAGARRAAAFAGSGLAGHDDPRIALMARLFLQSIPDARDALAALKQEAFAQPRDLTGDDVRSAHPALRRESAIHALDKAVRDIGQASRREEELQLLLAPVQPAARRLLLALQQPHTDREPADDRLPDMIAWPGEPDLIARLGSVAEEGAMLLDNALCQQAILAGARRMSILMLGALALLSPFFWLAARLRRKRALRAGAPG